MKIITLRDYIRAIVTLLDDSDTVLNPSQCYFSRDRVLEVLNDIAYDEDLRDPSDIEWANDHGGRSQDSEQEHRAGGALEAEVAPSVDDRKRSGRAPYSVRELREQLDPKSLARSTLASQQAQRLQARAMARRNKWRARNRKK